MIGHHFISYSSVDGRDFAIQLADALTAGPPPLPAWLDKRQLQAGEEWDEQLVEAIRVCESLLFVMTADSVEDESICKLEWMRAIKYKKPVIPLRLDPEAELPFRLGGRHYIDFSTDFDAGLARLRTRLQQISTPRGRLQSLNERLADAQRDLRRADGPRLALIKAEISELEQQIEQQKKLIANPEQVAKTTLLNIERAIERERYTEPQQIRRDHGTFINLPPATAPAYFQGRRAETRRIADFLEDPALRMLTVVGRGGIGKTALVCRLLKALEGGQLPDSGGPLTVDGIVYLSANGSRRVNLPNIYADLSKLLPAETAAQLDLYYRNPRLSTAFKLGELLQHFQAGRVVLLLDNFEDLLHPETQQITDRELDEALQALLTLPQHSVNVILTTRIVPDSLKLLEPGRQTIEHLDDGLTPPEAARLLRARDADGKAGLRDADEQMLLEAGERTRGYPRALEALYAILATDRDTSLPEMLADAERLLPEFVIQALVGEAFSRLDRTAQQVIEALAIYGRPVLPTAVEYLLQPFVPNIKTGPTLSRLVTMQFVRKQDQRYGLHPVDQFYALRRIPRGQPADRETRGTPPWTQLGLLHRGAEYFKQSRLPEQKWTKLSDISAQLDEFALRYAAEEYEAAAGALLMVDNNLRIWGHDRLSADLHEQLLGHLSDYRLQLTSLDNLGRAYNALGRYEQAISCHREALSLAKQHKNRIGEGYSLSGLGNCYVYLGQPLVAIKFLNEALSMAKELKDFAGEINRLTALGNCYGQLGHINQAINYHQQALSLSRETGDSQGLSTELGNLSLCFGELGLQEQAVEYLKQSLDEARKIGTRPAEGAALVNLAISSIDVHQLSEATQHARTAIQIGIDISSPRLSSYAHRFLALAQLYVGNLDQARAAAELARLYNSPDNNHTVLALLGLIALRQDDRAAAREAFTATVREADGLLKDTPQLYRALDSKALALCGLTLLDNESQRAAQAIEAYRAAREVTSAAGIVARAVRLLEAMQVLDTAGLLSDVRAAAAGETAG